LDKHMVHHPRILPARLHRGFTLVELLITISITAILAAIAVPAFTGMIDNSRATGATENLAATLRAAQTEAVKRHRTIVVSFQGSGSTTWCWGVSIGAACDCQNAPLGCRIDTTSRLVSSADYRGVTLTAANNYSFNPVRNTVNAGNTTFTSANNNQARVVISDFGRIRLCSPVGNLGGYPAC
jgi:type IV fimbrial biogenesis protein FimT